MTKKRIKNKHNKIIPKRNGNAKFIQMSKENIAPIPKIEKHLNFIKYGNDNNYPSYLIKLMSESGLHRAIIEKKVSLVLGKGLNIDDVSDDTLNFIDQPNPYESMDSILEKCSYDLEWFGGYYLQVLWDQNEDKVKEVYHMDAERIRVGKPNSYGFVESYYFFDDTTIPMSAHMNTNNAIHFPAFSKNGDKTEPQIYFVKKYSPTNKFYGSAIYEGAVIDIETYAEISNFHNSNLKNAFAPGYMIFFTGTPPSDDLQNDIVKSLKDKYGSTENVGKPMVFFLEDDMEKPIVEPLDTSNIDKQFEKLIEQIISNITVSHQIPRQVVGLETPGSLGGSKELLEATEIFKSSYIIPQQNVITNSFNVIMDINGLDHIEFVNPSPNIMLFDMAELMNILTVNELRDWLGFEKMEDTNDNDTLDEEKEIIKKETDKDE